MSTAGKVRILGVLVALGALVAARLLWGDAFEPKALIAELRRLGAVGGAVPLFFVLYAVGTTVLIPAVAFAIVAAVVWGYGPGAVIAMSALNVVGLGHFFLGRWLGREKVNAWLERRGWTGVAVRESGVGTVIAVRQLPLPFLAVNMALGASPLKWWHFVIGSAIGAVPPGLIYPYFATALIDGVEGAKQEAMVKALTGAAGMFLIAISPKLWRWWRARKRGQAAFPT